MRVISGKYQRKQLMTIDSENTRPTTDRVKENIFNLIQNHIYDKAVLDLFAGSGALGIEAISRGAQIVYFVEKSTKSLNVLKKNLGKITEEYVCYSNDALIALEGFSARQMTFDLIFLDPPYKSNLIEESLKLIYQYNLLKENGIIVIETDCSTKLNLESYILVKEKKYGNTKIYILQGDVQNE